MLLYGPTGALSEYQYKGGVFHAVHYGDYHSDSGALFAMMDKEEEFLLKSTQKRRILFDLYHTDMTPEVVGRLITHLSHISSGVYKIAFAAEPAALKKMRNAVKKYEPIPFGCCKFDESQDACKTWLVSDGFD